MQGACICDSSAINSIGPKFVNGLYFPLQVSKIPGHFNHHLTSRQLHPDQLFE